MAKKVVFCQIKNCSLHCTTATRCVNVSPIVGTDNYIRLFKGGTLLFVLITINSLIHYLFNANYYYVSTYIKQQLEHDIDSIWR